MPQPKGTLHYYRRGRPSTGDESIFTTLGGHELGLTRGLAAVIGAHPEVGLRLLSIPEVRRVLTLTDVVSQISAVSSMAVDAEEIQPDSRRRDIVLRLYTPAGLLLTVIIEAKSTGDISSPTSVAAIQSQLGQYLDADSEADTPGSKRVGIALTRVRNLGGDARIATITWTDVIDALGAHPSLVLAKQFRNHLLMSSSLRYFDTEVLSVPAGDTITSVRQFRIHAHPAQRARRVALYLAPRSAGGGEVDALYGIASVFDVDLVQRTVQVARLHEDNPDLAARVDGYLTARAARYPEEELERVVLRVYDLSGRIIPLPHLPHPRRNHQSTTAGWCLADFLDASSRILPDLADRGPSSADAELLY